MKLPIPITHLPHPSHRQWAWITMAVYASSALTMIGGIALIYLFLN